MNFIDYTLKHCPSAANKYGWIFFQLGIISLPSSSLIAGILLIISLLFASQNRPISYWKDPWNLPFIIASFPVEFIKWTFFYSEPSAWIFINRQIV